MSEVKRYTNCLIYRDVDKPLPEMMPHPEGLYVLYEDYVKLEATLKRRTTALEEIQWLFDGEADIDNNGNPNRAMKINTIIDALQYPEAPRG